MFVQFHRANCSGSLVITLTVGKLSDDAEKIIAVVIMQVHGKIFCFAVLDLGQDSQLTGNHQTEESSHRRMAQRDWLVGL